MKKESKRWLSLLLCMALLLGMTACQKQGETTSSVPEKATAQPSPSDTPTPLLYQNPLTGLPEKTDLSQKRPVAVMINNAKVATPQEDISKADVIYECNMEGGYTRLMCLFTHPEELINLGSVRSSRDYFLDLAQNHDAIYFHAGGSPEAYHQIKIRDIDNVDGVNGYIKNTFYRDSARKKKMGYEHSLMINSSGIERAIAVKKYRTEMRNGFESPFHFGDKAFLPESENGKYLKVKYSSYITAEFIYDANMGMYEKKQFGQKHIDGKTGEQLSFENVVVMFASETSLKDEKGRIAISLTGSGKGYYLNNGRLENITWKKAERDIPMKLYNHLGEILTMNPGKTYICVVPTSMEKSLVASNSAQ